MPSKRKAPTSSSGSAKKIKAEDYVIKAKRAPKDPNAPKNAKSAYMFFAAKCRAELTKESPGMSFTDTGREVGKRWQALSDKQKAPWEKKSSDDKDRHAKDMKTYVPDAAYTEQQKKMKAAGPKLAKDPDKPKRGRTAYLVFCDDHRDAVRKKYPKKSMTEVSAALAQQWKSVSKKERGTCDETAEKEKKDYQTALASYEPSPEYRAAVEMIQSAKAANQLKDKSGSKKVSERVKKQRVKVRAKFTGLPQFFGQSSGL
jgi:hypothetical protein